MSVGDGIASPPPRCALPHCLLPSVCSGCLPSNRSMPSVCIALSVTLTEVGAFLFCSRAMRLAVMLT
jgi:hypothetical protein